MSESDRLESIFTQAMQLPNDAERSRYVEHACGEDSQLAQRVFSLLKAARESASFLESPLLRQDAANDAEPAVGHRQPGSPGREFSFLAPPIATGDIGSLGQYRILNCVGRGGMGIVFRAFDPKLQRIVAVKVLAPETAIDPLARKRFEREARSAAAVSHPHLVVIHAVDESYNPPYLVMEFIQGKTLADKIATQGALTVKEILRIGGQVAEGLAAAHKHGLVHRDLKPANILLENGVERAKLTDFGLAKAVDDMAMTRTGDLSGTPQYMSPEQASGGLIDHRSDLFSLGSVLYAMCTGKPPFRADHPLALLKRVCEEVPRPVQQINPDVPDWLSRIVDRLLAKAPEDRFQKASDVAVLLQKCLAKLQSGSSNAKPTRNSKQQAAATSGSQRKFPTVDNSPAPGFGGNSLLRFTRSLPAVMALGGAIAVLALAVFVLSVWTPLVSVNVKNDDQHTPVSVGNSPADQRDGAADGSQVVTTKVDATKPGEVKAATLGGMDYVSPGSGIKFKLIPAGEGWIGGRNLRQIAIDKPFYLGIHTVTQSQWLSVMGTKPWQNEAEDPDFPVAVTWPETQEFCRKLSLLDKLSYRLPNDVESEYACRAGSRTTYHFGDNPQELSKYAWFKENTSDVGEPYAHKVGTKLPNDWGLYDMHGNIAQWCDNLGPGESSKRMIRGVGWAQDAKSCVASHGRAIWPSNRGGFRLALTLEKSPGPTGESRFFFETPGFAAWADNVATRSAEQQLEAVSQKLRELHPEFDGTLTGPNLSGKPTIVGSAVDSLGIQTDHITDLSPLRALSTLNVLWCEGSAPSQGKLRDLSPLKGMKLKELRCRRCPLVDLSPLQGMPLESIDFFSTLVNDLSPLTGMQLRDANIEGTKVQDLAPFQGMPLRGLNCPNTPISDLEPLKGMKLEYLSCAGTRVSSIAPLRGMPLVAVRVQDTLVSDLSPLIGSPLKVIFTGNNNVSDYSPLYQCQTLTRAHLLGKKVDPDQIASLQKAIPGCKIALDGAEPANVDRNNPTEVISDPQRRSFKEWMSDVVKQPAERQLELVAQKLQELNPNFDGKLTGFDGSGPPKIEDGVITELGFRTSQARDIAPVKALLDLRALNIDGDWSAADGKVSDLTPLRGMRLKMLSCNHTQVFDLSPLRAMPLFYLSCFGSRVESLEPLKGMKLSSLVLGGTNVADLTPLRGMPISKLNFGGTLVSDLSPLEGMPLLELGCAAGRVSDLSPLNGMKLALLHFKPERIVNGMATIREMETLTKFHVIFRDEHEHLSAEDFWKNYDAGRYR